MIGDEPWFAVFIERDGEPRFFDGCDSLEETLEFIRDYMSEFRYGTCVAMTREALLKMLPRWRLLEEEEGWD